MRRPRRPPVELRALGAGDRAPARDGALEDVSVLFAGGIHDARSAAMVAAMAAPLAARGAKVGVLMGTAYLFTEEAVAAAPSARVPGRGHRLREHGRCSRRRRATRPAASRREFVRAFVPRSASAPGRRARAPRRLGSARAAQPRPPAHRRQGPRARRRIVLAAVSEAEQQRRGDVHDRPGRRPARATRMHDRPSFTGRCQEQSTRQLSAIEVPPRLRPASEAGPTSPSSGIACLFPDAPDRPAFWATSSLGKNAIREVPQDRWNPETLLRPGWHRGEDAVEVGRLLAPDHLRSRRLRHPPPIARRHRSRAAPRARGRAARRFSTPGVTDRTVRPRTGERRLRRRGGHRPRERLRLPRELPSLHRRRAPRGARRALPKLTEDSFPGVLANVLAGRIANRLDLRGVNYTVDAACASSLAAVDVACKELASGASDHGRGRGRRPPQRHPRLSHVRQRPRALDDGAVQTVRRQRRRHRARRGDRGDRSEAARRRRARRGPHLRGLKGVGGSSDGKSLGLTAPRKEGQIRALERAYARAGVSPATVGLVEAHGTGTVVGDRTELATLTEFFGTAGALPKTCTLGSVKSQIGHAKCAAGMAGLIKAALALHHGVLPPTKNVDLSEPRIRRRYQPVRSARHLRPVDGRCARRRRERVRLRWDELPLRPHVARGSPPEPRGHGVAGRAVRAPRSRRSGALPAPRYARRDRVGRGSPEAP